MARWDALTQHRLNLSFYILVENAISCCLQHYIQIDVWDYDTLNRDDFMGRLQIPLSLLSEETTARWYPLGRGSAKDNVHGEIFLELTLTASQVQNIKCLEIKDGAF